MEGKGIQEVSALLAVTGLTGAGIGLMSCSPSAETAETGSDVAGAAGNGSGEVEDAAGVERTWGCELASLVFTLSWVLVVSLSAW